MDSAWQWVVAFVAYDFCYYWKHRFGHEWRIMWASHIAHHQSEEFNLSTALRQTGTDYVGFVFYIPLYLAGVPAADGDHGRQPQSHLPVLGAHGAHPPARAAGMDSGHALQPSCAPRAQSRVHRQELRRRLHSLGSPVRHVPGRAQGCAVRLRHHHRAEELESAVGEPAFLERHREARVAHAQLGRQVAHLVQAAGLVSGGPGSEQESRSELSQSSIRPRVATRVCIRSLSTGC